jgi:hypothetical protein
MDMHSLKLIELALIVGIVGYFYLRSRRPTERSQDRQDEQPSDENSNTDPPS